MASTSLIDSPATPELPLFDRLPREMAPASMLQWERIMATLSARERAVYLALCETLLRTGHQDATGGEVAEHSGISLLGVRPRLTALHDKGWVIRTVDVRESRARGECRAHAYSPVVPRSAVERIVA